MTSNNQPTKRRKTEKPPPIAANGGVPMEKSLSAVLGSNARNPPGSPTFSVIDAKKKGKSTTTTATNGRRRYVLYLPIILVY
jgi:hypothetical protein